MLGASARGARGAARSVGAAKKRLARVAQREGATTNMENPMPGEKRSKRRGARGARSVGAAKTRLARAAQRSEEEARAAVAGAVRDVPVVGNVASVRRRARGRERGARRNGARGDDAAARAAKRNERKEKRKAEVAKRQREAEEAEAEESNY